MKSYEVANYCNVIFITRLKVPKEVKMPVEEAKSL
jgi:hypothetical protein